MCGIETLDRKSEIRIISDAFISQFSVSLRIFLGDINTVFATSVCNTVGRQKGNNKRQHLEPNVWLWQIFSHIRQTIPFLHYVFQMNGDIYLQSQIDLRCDLISF